MASSREVLDSVLNYTGKTQKEAAESIGMSPQSLWSKLNINTFRASEFLSILYQLGVEISLISKQDSNVTFNIFIENADIDSLVDDLIKLSKTSKSQAARTVDLTYELLKQRMKRNSLKADMFLDLLDGLGFDVHFIVKETGHTLIPHIKGYGRKIKKMANLVMYNTEKSSALSNSFFEDGIHEYNNGKAVELYIDSEGRYFFAEYDEKDHTKDTIIPATADIAIPFIEKYGTEIYKVHATQ